MLPRTNLKLKLLMSVFISIPILLFGIDNDLENMHLNDANKMKAEDSFITARGGYAYSEWKIPNMSSFKQETQGLNLAWIDLIYKGNMDNVDGYKNYLHYERSFNKNWNEKVIYQEDAMNNTEVISGKVTLPFQYKDISFFVKGSKERYLTQITSKYNTNFIDKSGKLNSLTNGDNLVFETKFNEIAFGIDKKSYFIESFLFDIKGIFLFFDDYQKPFTIRQYNKEVEEHNTLLYYAKMKSYGLGLDFEKKIDNFYMSLGLKFGFKSEIKLKDDLKLTDLNFNDSSFSQSDLKIGYSFNPIKSIQKLRMHILGVYSHRLFDEKLEGDNVAIYVDGQWINIDTKDSQLNNDEIKKLFISFQYSF
jgi:hypothetical protein